MADKWGISQYGAANRVYCCVTANIAGGLFVAREVVISSVSAISVGLTDLFFLEPWRPFLLISFDSKHLRNGNFGNLGADPIQAGRKLPITRLLRSLKILGTGNGEMGWRRTIGTVLLLTPLWGSILFILTGILLGSMGMDIHWTSNKGAYIGWTTLVLAFSACVMAGVKLRRRPRD
jgi:hypothetical protein